MSEPHWDSRYISFADRHSLCRLEKSNDSFLSTNIENFHLLGYILTMNVIESRFQPYWCSLISVRIEIKRENVFRFVCKFNSNYYLIGFETNFLINNYSWAKLPLQFGTPGIYRECQIEKFALKFSHDFFAVCRCLRSMIIFVLFIVWLQ